MGGEQNRDGLRNLEMAVIWMGSEVWGKYSPSKGLLWNFFAKRKHNETLLCSRVPKLASKIESIQKRALRTTFKEGKVLYSLLLKKASVLFKL